MVPHDELSPQRVEAAAAVRRLIHAMVGHQGSDQDLGTVALEVDRLAARIEQGPARVRSNQQMMRYPEPVPDGSELTCWPDCMVAGVAHPQGTGLRGRREGDEVVAEVTLGPAHEGPPGRAHGGMIASLFDEVFGFALWMHAVPAYTAWLKVDYRQPLLLGRHIELRASVSAREGRKVFVAGTAGHDGAIMAEAEGLFVVPREFESVVADAAPAPGSA